MPDISLTMPAIRQHLWSDFYESAARSCSNHSFELVIASPFDLPDSLKDKTNIVHIKDYGNPSRATQLANIAATGDLIYNCVDDGVFTNHALDWVVDYFKRNCGELDVVNMRYREAPNGDGGVFPLESWKAGFHGDLRLPGINPEWGIALHFVMKRQTYLDFGGIDCEFEYSNHGIHDLMFRLQAAGGCIHPSELDGLNCTHLPGESGDHAPIHKAQTFHDGPRFANIYKSPTAAHDRKCLDLENWKSQSEVWDKRDCSNVQSYEDLYK
jgi:hypothetical protein